MVDPGATGAVAVNYQANNYKEMVKDIMKFAQGYM